MSFDVYVIFACWLRPAISWHLMRSGGHPWRALQSGNQATSLVIAVMFLLSPGLSHESRRSLNGSLHNLRRAAHLRLQVTANAHVTELSSVAQHRRAAYSPITKDVADCRTWW
ncbi:hypothetical protein OBBRIDRAFT_596070 [Obba rivulosa]|uniref:Uncharacterized protein n=1 Tax=Obba rivulosa TaxID=1052685 RepID=A0A8E2B387_9APHY|nr:hypothetical protein OBBRIDRAFT_596070 [Obba rivulosa]